MTRIFTVPGTVMRPRFWWRLQRTRAHLTRKLDTTLDTLYLADDFEARADLLERASGMYAELALNQPIEASRERGRWLSTASGLALALADAERGRTPGQTMGGCAAQVLVASLTEADMWERLAGGYADRTERADAMVRLHELAADRLGPAAAHLLTRVADSEVYLACDWKSLQVTHPNRRIPGFRNRGTAGLANGDAR